MVHPFRIHRQGEQMTALSLSVIAVQNYLDVGLSSMGVQPYDGFRSEWPGAVIRHCHSKWLTAAVRSTEVGNEGINNPCGVANAFPF